MLTLYFSPHMQSTDNVLLQASGHADVLLTENGRRDALKMRQHFASIPIDCVYSSDLQRASATAQIIFAERQIPINFDARLRECNYGQMTQHPVQEIEKAFPQHITRPFPDGESVLMVTQHVGSLLAEILNKSDQQVISIIGHRVTKWAIEYWCGGQSITEIVNKKWQRLEVPIWNFTLTQEYFNERENTLKSTYSQL